MKKLFGEMRPKVKNNKIDYTKFHFTGRQWILWSIVGMMGAMCMIMIFYRSTLMIAIAGIAVAILKF